MFAAIVNLLTIGTKKEVAECIVHFITVEVIMEIPKFYFESMKEPELQKLMHHSLHVVKKGKDIKFMERPFSNKIQRIVYIFLRAIYTSLFFYFFPYLLIALNFISSIKTNDDHQKH